MLNACNQWMGNAKKGEHKFVHSMAIGDEMCVCGIRTGDALVFGQNSIVQLSAYVGYWATEPWSWKSPGPEEINRPGQYPSPPWIIVFSLPDSHYFGTYFIIGPSRDSGFPERELIFKRTASVILFHIEHNSLREFDRSSVWRELEFICAYSVWIMSFTIDQSCSEPSRAVRWVRRVPPIGYRLYDVHLQPSPSHWSANTHIRFSCFFLQLIAIWSNWFVCKFTIGLS